MQVEIYHQYSKLDKEHQFGILFKDETKSYTIFINWVWFYMGVFLGEKRPIIYPYKPVGFDKKPKVYKSQGDAKRQAKLISNYIKRTSQK